MVRHRRHRGSVLLMVIGLLTIIAMLGSMLLLLARLDKQTSQAIATTAPEQQVAEGILDRLLADRLADLWIAGQGTADPNDDVLYGNVAADPNVAERQRIDYPHEDYDPALATIEPVGGTEWRHISHVPGTVLRRDPNTPVDPSAPYNVPVAVSGANQVVDTDGDGLGDACLFDTGILDRDGGTFYAAVRMIDAGGLVNANTANDLNHLRPATWGQTMDPNDVAMHGLAVSMDPNNVPMGVTDVVASALVSSRTSGGAFDMFDMGDMLATRWYGSDPCAGYGRLINAFKTEPNYRLDPGRFYLTTQSAFNVGVCPMRGTTPKRNPNSSTGAELYGAFLAIFWTHNQTDPNNCARAMQLTVNLVDYFDPDSDVTMVNARTIDDISFPSDIYFYGIERHPFVSKVFLKRRCDPAGEEILPRISALELMNPYAQPIRLTGHYELVNPPVALNGDIPGNGGRFIIYSDPMVRRAADEPNQQIALDVTDPITILWRDPNGWTVCVDESPAVNDCNMPVPAGPGMGGETWRAKFRDDGLPSGRYSLYLHADSPLNDPLYDYTVAATMGTPNPALIAATAAAGRDPAPVYVRNGPMVNLGELMRICTVGPTDLEPLSFRLADPNVTPFNRQLLPAAGVIPTGAMPAVPVGCAVTEYFNLIYSPTVPPTTPGLININTAPLAVLRCLPGLSEIADPNAPQEIVAYRDLQTVGARDYSNRSSATGIVNLRQQPGFACAGEVAIPLAIAQGGPINAYDPNNLPPLNYALGPGPDDDGIGIVGNPGVLDDPVKSHVLYTWLSNQVAVRSNTYIAYIRVQRGTVVNAPARHYVAVIDRSHCTTLADRPKVLMFAELR